MHYWCTVFVSVIAVFLLDRCHSPADIARKRSPRGSTTSPESTGGGGVAAPQRGGSMKETDHPTPGSGEGGSIKLEPPGSIKNENDLGDHGEEMKPGDILHKKQNGHSDGQMPPGK